MLKRTTFCTCTGKQDSLTVTSIIWFRCNLIKYKQGILFCFIMHDLASYKIYFGQCFHTPIKFKKLNAIFNSAEVRNYWESYMPHLWLKINVITEEKQIIVQLSSEYLTSAKIMVQFKAANYLKGLTVGNW